MFHIHVSAVIYTLILAWTNSQVMNDIYMDEQARHFNQDAIESTYCNSFSYHMFIRVDSMNGVQKWFALIMTRRSLDCWGCSDYTLSLVVLVNGVSLRYLGVSIHERLLNVRYAIFEVIWHLRCIHKNV